MNPRSSHYSIPGKEKKKGERRRVQDRLVTEKKKIQPKRTGRSKKRESSVRKGGFDNSVLQ